MDGLLSQFGPHIAAMAPSFIVGFLAGKLAKKALKKTLLIGGIGLAVLVALGMVSLDAETTRTWAQSGAGWLNENLKGASAYLAALLPSATAAAAGGALGFRGRSRGPVKNNVSDAARDGVKSRIRNR
jgi:uncharacterized membrane protein (Fun14 family)